MLGQPFDQTLSSNLAGSNAYNERLLFIHTGPDFMPIQNQEDFHRCMAQSLIPIDKRMVLHQGKAQRAGLLDQRPEVKFNDVYRPDHRNLKLGLFISVALYQFGCRLDLR